MRHWSLVLVFSLILNQTGCSSGGSSNPDANGDTNPYESLMGVAVGEIQCSEDECCFGRCWGNEDIVCVTRSLNLIRESIENPAGVPVCEMLIFPEWFYNYDCFVGTGGIVGPGHPSQAGKPLSFQNSYDSNEHSYTLFVQCFCGRGSNSYSSEYSANMVLYDQGCGEVLVPFDDGSGTYYQDLFTCDNPCVTCTPDCAGKTCGTDACGGTCGACSAGFICNAVGQCATEGTQDSCSACLATCRGMTSCCTGCGCLCQDECGGCF